MYSPVLVTPPATAPITLDEAKAHLRVDNDESDSLITGLIAAAVSHLDGENGMLGRSLMAQTWREDFDQFSSCMRLQLRPVGSISSVKYDDADNVEQTVASGNYDLRADDLGSYVRFNASYSFPALHADGPSVRVAYVAGYDDSDAVPASIKQAMLLLIGAWFENREETVVGVSVAGLSRSVAVDALLSPWRRMVV